MMASPFCSEDASLLTTAFFVSGFFGSGILSVTEGAVESVPV